MNLTFHKKHSASHGTKNFSAKVTNDPYVDWVLVLLVSLLCGAVVIVGAVLLFLEIKKNAGALPGNVSTNPHSIINQVELTKIVDSFAEKKAASETIKKTPYTVAGDPSL